MAADRTLDADPQLQVPEAAASPRVELRRYSRALAAATIGSAAGYLINQYINNLFAPELIAEFGWSRSDFALISLLGLFNLMVLPVIGRMTDIYGVRRIAAIGVVAYPLTFVAYSLMSGSFVMFAAITVVQNLLVTGTTTSTVYTRLIAERFVTARGLALAIAATAPACIGMLASPLLMLAIENFGWRMSYLFVACYVALAGVLALMLTPPRMESGSGESPKPRQIAKHDYAFILRQRVFWIITVALLLGNMIYPLQSSQMQLLLLEKGADSQTASWLISLFAAGVMLGRFICGISLDRLPVHLVAAFALGLPGVGLLLIEGGADGLLALSIAVLLLGGSMGAESDLFSFLTMRYFPKQMYSSVLGLIVSGMALSASLGALALSVTLKLTDRFDLFILIGGMANIAGGSLLLFLPRRHAADP